MLYFSGVMGLFIRVKEKKLVGTLDGTFEGYQRQT